MQATQLTSSRSSILTSARSLQEQISSALRGLHGRHTAAKRAQRTFQRARRVRRRPRQRRRVLVLFVELLREHRLLLANELGHRVRRRTRTRRTRRVYAQRVVWSIVLLRRANVAAIVHLQFDLIVECEHGVDCAEDGVAGKPLLVVAELVEGAKLRIDSIQCP